MAQILGAERSRAESLGSERSWQRGLGSGAESLGSWGRKIPGFGGREIWVLGAERSWEERSQVLDTVKVLKKGS